MRGVTIAFVFFNSSIVVCAQQKNFIDQPYIEVTGSADTLVIPDKIFIKIIISEKDTKNKISVEELEGKMVFALEKMGINIQKDLFVSDLISRYRFYLLKQKDVMKSKEFILKVSDATSVSNVFSQLEDLDISNVSIEKVEHSQMENIKNACRIKAIENAKNKAITLTRPLSQNIGPAINIIDNENYFDGQLQGKIAGIQIRGIGSFNSAKFETPHIEFEKIKVQQGVSAKFILR